MIALAALADGQRSDGQPRHPHHHRGPQRPQQPWPVVRVDVCPQARFLADGCPWHTNLPAHPGTMIFTIAGVPPGDYAVQAFHDENDNDRIDRGLFGLPKEGVGFSRDARIVFSPPKWSDAVFTHGSTAADDQLFPALFLWSGKCRRLEEEESFRVEPGAIAPDPGPVSFVRRSALSQRRRLLQPLCGKARLRVSTTQMSGSTRGLPLVS